MIGLSAATTLGLAPIPAQAATPQVSFDVNYLVDCREVTPPEFAEINPDEKLMEARFQISSLLHHGHDGDLLGQLYRIESVEKSFAVVDYLPKTTLTTDVAGNLAVQQQREKAASAGLSISGKYDRLLSGSLTGSGSTKNNSSIRFERLPPLDLLAASGTTQRGCGAFFKLRPSSQTSLEGSKDFVLILRVPAEWRGDLVKVTCEASRKHRGIVPPVSGSKQCGRGVFAIALYAETDSEAKAAATALVRAEHALRQVAAAQRSKIEDRAYPTLAHEIGGALSFVDPKIPSDWLRRYLENPGTARAEHIARRLPPEVRRAVLGHAAAKATLRRLNAHAAIADYSEGS